MNLLETLTRAADEEQLRLRPLPTHAAAAQKEHLRKHYALLLAAVLTTQPAVSEPQTRLLRMLLDALQLGDIRGQLFEQARDLTPEPLLEAARLIREADFAQHLVVDVLVLLRLDAPLSDDAARLVGELAIFLNLNESDLVTRAADAANILGLPMSQPNQPDGEESEDSASEADTTPHCPPSMAELWPSLISQPLTAEALRAGLQGGLWRLDDNLDVDFPWQATNAVLHFTNGAILNTFAKEGAIKLADCHLFDVALDFQGACSINLERCDWKGNYDPAAKRTALNSIGQTVTAVDCRFSTKNARTIAVINDGHLSLVRCSFKYCGHDKLDGGAAIWLFQSNAYIPKEFGISDCLFYRCVGACGGALRMNYLACILQCEFFACRSLNYVDGMQNIAIYASNTREKSLVKCVLRDASVYIKELDTKFDSRIGDQNQFVGSNVWCPNLNNGKQWFYDAKFSNGAVCSFTK